MHEKATVSNNKQKKNTNLAQRFAKHENSTFTTEAHQLYVAPNTTANHKWLCEKLIRHTSLQRKKMRLAVITILQKLTITSTFKHNILPVHTTAGYSTRSTLAEQSKMNNLLKTCTSLLIQCNPKKQLIKLKENQYAHINTNKLPTLSAVGLNTRSDSCQLERL